MEMVNGIEIRGYSHSGLVAKGIVRKPDQRQQGKHAEKHEWPLCQATIAFFFVHGTVRSARQTRHERAPLA